MQLTQNSFSGDIYADERDLRQCWEETIAVGNEYFMAQRYDEALHFYLDAVEVADKLFICAADQRAAMAALLVSYHNLADLYIQNQQIKMAGEALLLVYRKLSQELQPETCGSARMEALIWACSRAYRALVLHCKQYPDLHLDIPTYHFHLSHLQNQH